MTDPALKEAVERVTRDMEMSRAEDDLHCFCYSADLRTILTAISTQAATLEAMASALEELIPSVTAYTMSGSDLAQGLKRHAWEPALTKARTTLTQYRQGVL